jgi:hypothetical protein
VCIDRGCFGCVPVSRRERYVGRIAALVRVGGVWVLKVHRAAPVLRAHGFTSEEVVQLAAASFEPIAVRESTLRFGEAGEQPAWTLELRRRAT